MLSDCAIVNDRSHYACYGVGLAGQKLRVRLTAVLFTLGKLFTLVCFCHQIATGQLNAQWVLMLYDCEGTVTVGVGLSSR